jgi:hypothetical protein
MNRRRTPLSTNNANRQRREYNPWQDFASQDALLRKHKSRQYTLPTQRQTLTGLLLGAALATTISTCSMYQRISPTIESFFHKTPTQAEEIAGPIYLSPTPFMDKLQEAPLDSLGLDLAIKNTGILIREAYQPLFTTLEEINGRKEHPLPTPLVMADAIKEPALENLAEDRQYGMTGEAYFYSSTGIPGVFPLTKRRVFEYNKRHPDAPLTMWEMHDYEKNMPAGIEELQRDIMKGQGIFPGLIRWVSGPATLLALQENYPEEDTLCTKLMYDSGKGLLRRQAQRFPYDVAVLTYMVQAQAVSAGATLEELHIDPADVEYNNFVALGKYLYGRGKEESRKKWDGKPSTKYDPRLSRMYDERLIRESRFSAAIVDSVKMARERQQRALLTQNSGEVTSGGL